MMKRIPGLASILNHMNENLFSKDEPAINEHHYHITKKTITKTRITYTIKIKPKHTIFNIIYIYIYTDEHYYNKTQNANNNITNSISKKKLHLIMNMCYSFKKRLLF